MKPSLFPATAVFALASAFLSAGQGQSASAEPPRPRQHIIESRLDDLDHANAEFAKSKGGPEHNQLERVATPARAGNAAFRHWVDKKGERSEFAFRKTDIGGTYWYGWSLYLPADFEFGGSPVIVMQLATFPTPRNGKFPCTGNGSFIHLDARGRLIFHLQRQGDDTDMVCDKFTLHDDLSPLRGQWLDFVMHAKWTGDPDGFVKVWLKPGREPYTLKMNYRGGTFWNDEDRGPYFKMGLYLGDPGWQGPAERTLYTDEYRLGSAAANFADVAPGDEPLTLPKP